MKITSQRIEVMVWWLLLVLPLSTATLCRTGHQFWNETLGKCLDCTKCTHPGDLVLRPCQIHQDAVCGPLASLDIDWSFLGRSHKHHRRPQQSSSEVSSESDKEVSSSESSEFSMTNRTNASSSEEFEKRNHKKPHHKKWPHRGKHHHKKHNSHCHNKTRSHHHHKFEWSSSDILPESTNSSEFENVFGWTSSSSVEHHEVTSNSRKSKHSHSNHRNSSKSQRHKPESASQLKEQDSVINSTKVHVITTGTSEPFSATEELVWDWQAVALGLAVFACVFFFLVACVYSVHHARQWRRLKDHFDDFEADVGELSTRLSLLLPTLQNDERGTVTPDCCTNSSQCIYLEKLLARKRQEEEGVEHGNVYIDRDVVTVHRA